MIKLCNGPYRVVYRGQQVVVITCDLYCFWLFPYIPQAVDSGIQCSQYPTHLRGEPRKTLYDSQTIIAARLSARHLILQHALGRCIFVRHAMRVNVFPVTLFYACAGGGLTRIFRRCAWRMAEPSFPPIH